MALKFVINDITKMDVEAIVNAANESLLGGGGVDGAIHRAAGPQLLEFNKTLGGAKTTEAKISPGFNLKAKYIIHAVGPIYHGGNDSEEEKLYLTYTNALNKAKQNNIKSIAFPLISTGAYHFPKRAAFEIALKAITDFLKNEDIEVFLVFFDQNFLDEILKQPLSEVETYIKGNIKISDNNDRNLKINNISFIDYLNSLFLKNKLKANEIRRQANIDHKTFTKIWSDGKIEKATVIALALALDLDLKNTEKFLAKAGYSFDNTNETDLVIKWHIEKRRYSIFDLSLLLLRLGLKPLF